MRIRPDGVRFTNVTQPQPSQPAAPVATPYSASVRNVNMDTPAVLDKPSPQDWKKAQESMKEVRKDVAELQRLEAERSALKNEKEQAKQRILELKSAINKTMIDLQHQVEGGGNSDQRHELTKALSELSAQMHQEQSRLQDLDHAMDDNLQITMKLRDEVSSGIAEATRLSGKDPTTARFLNAVQNAVNRGAWPAALVRCDDANKHLAEQYRKALIESAARTRADDRLMQL